ncbi:zinc finger protein 184-like isoform X2 [Poecilia latipinna]|uniref:zinc finger protein 184-like isoform X2 n=1 Tax=Poecilia latipinna TaxID=48699 RepID=UPI00072E5EB8|nr:PREDICTED: zinc finger protein 184-like isoform X2 [Poecilia latipinna]
MSDSLMRGVRVQLTTTMDSVLRTAVFEVMRILESALYNHKMEMAQKGEEIAQLKIKLQAAEIKLKDFEMSSQRRAETTETQSKPKVVPVAPEQPITVPEIDVEVPDDWCAPLGCDTSNRQEEGCPSVRLRQFSIRLFPVPLVKHEENNNVINVQKSPVGRRSKRISAMNEKPNPSQDESKPGSNRAARHPKISGDLNKLLHGLSKDYCDLSGLDRLRKRRTSEETLTDNDKKEKKDEEDSLKNEEKNQRKSKYICKTCYKVLNTKKGMRAHERFQKKCKGCLKAFCFQNDVKYHKRVCAEYKKSMKEKYRLQGNKTPVKKKALDSSKAEGIGIKEITQSSADKKNPSTRKFSCKKCSYKTNSRKKFRRHKMCHSEKMQTSPVCQEILDEKKEFDVHEKKHKSLMQVSNQNGDLGWTEPLEDVDEDGGLKRGEKMQE